MINFGPVPIGAVLPVFFATYGKTNGESITLTGLAVTDIEIYKGTSITQRASDAGYALIDTDGIDVDGVTGIHAFSIDTGDNTDAGFYAAGSYYTVVVSAVTVDSQTVNFIAATFRCVTAESVASQPKVDVAAFGGTALTAAAGIPEVKVASLANNAITAASINADAITAAKIADGAIDAATFAANAITSTVLAADAITAAKLAADVTTELQSGLATAASLSTLDGKADSILADTNELQTDWANGGRLDLLIDSIITKVDAVDDFLDTEIAAILAAVDTEVAAIKAKTDSLTFTVANKVDSNLHAINGTTVNGDGAGTPWGP